MSRPVFGETLPSAPMRHRWQERNAIALASGMHPITAQPLRTDGATCGQCRHCAAVEMAHTYYKCRKAPKITGGPATDLRKRWPACAWFEAKGETT